MTDEIDRKIIEKELTNYYFLNNINLNDSKSTFINSKPFKHIFLENLWNDLFLTQVSDEVANFNDWEGEKKFFGSQYKRYQSKWEKLPPQTYKLINFLNSPFFLKMLSFITNEKHLIPDPYLTGGGIHSTKENGFLKLHADFNWHKEMEVYRRINVLIYLNKNWNKDFGGQIELGIKKNNGSFEIFKSALPIFNRTLIFITDDHSFHGQPNPVKNTNNRSRDSIATYYYQSKKPKNSSNEKRTGTNYINKFGKTEKGKLKDRIKLKIKNWVKF
jgi:Rps23 Pro-64 3,4-dihydroxylase Tpa1-like proline 4-hydroxylase